MIDLLSFSITLACVVTALVVAVRLVRGRFEWTPAARLLAGIEAVLLVQAVLDVAFLVGGHRPREPVTHLAYLAVAVVVLPVALAQTRGESGRWAGSYVVVALLVTAVLVIRLQTTWRSAAA